MLLLRPQRRTHAGYPRTGKEGPRIVPHRGEDPLWVGASIKVRIDAVSNL
jgi:hypothetical protein